MDRKTPILILFLGIIVQGLSQNFALSVLPIPDSLQKNADAVIRFHHTEITRKSAGKAVLRVHYAITVLNKNGRSDAWLTVFYDEDKKVNYIRGKYYNGLGVEVDKVEKDDILDFSAYPDFTFFSDNRVKAVKPVRNQYPYTAEFEYELVMNGIVGFDTWMPVTVQGVSLEEAELVFKTPNDLPVRYKTGNRNFDFLETTEKNTVIYRWRMENFPAYQKEVFLPSKRDFLPFVMLAPVEFEYDGSHGNFENWKNYGTWVNNLLYERDEIPEEMKEKITALVSTETSPEARVKKVYEFVQQSTRYVNISLGIGGFQPMEANEVIETGYGDCKALTNYTGSLLKAIGIMALYAEIGNGSERGFLYPDFPSINQTNHVILCVPLEHDSIWLECTDQNLPFGYIGSGNANRNALLTTPEGGVLAATPTYHAADNFTLTKINAVLLPDGDLHCSASIAKEGLSCGKFFFPLHSSEKQQKEWILKNLLPGQSDIENFSFSEHENGTYKNSLDIEFTVGNYASRVGQRLMIEPNVLNKYISALSKQKERHHDIRIETGYAETDSITIRLPESWKLEFVPKADSTICLLGNYQFSCDTINGEILMVRNLTINPGTYPKEDYSGIHEFFKTMATNDEKKIVLIKAE